MKSLISVLVALILFSCGTSKENKIDKTEQSIISAEKNIEALDSTKLEKLETEITQLQNDLEENRNKYSDEQIKRIGILQGRYAAILVKKGIGEFQKGVNQFKSQLDGFMEGLNNSTPNR